LAVTEKIVKKIRSVIHNVPLVLKVGYYQNNKDLERLAAIANGYANDVAGINTLQATVVNENGGQALPGASRLLSGICGDGIRWAGLDFVRRLKKIKDQNKYTFSITGIGGVMKPEDYTHYRKVGADAVMSATGVMWNPLLAQEIKKKGSVVALVSSQAMETRF
jgi:dihydroorotate dehydrogenase